MQNAYSELESFLRVTNKSWDKIKLAKIACRVFDFETNEYARRITYVKNSCSLDVFKQQLQKLNYDDDYGTQNLYGFVVFDDNTWLERYEYDGAECWSYKKTPKQEDEI